MDAKEAIKFLQDNLDSRPVSEGYIGVSFWRTELEEVIKALREALEWQPMETAPDDKEVLLKFKNGIAVAYLEKNYSSCLREDRGNVWCDVTTGNKLADYFGSPIGWKEVE